MLVSIIIPTYNRKPILEKCLLALEDQKLPSFIQDYEIVVVDDGSTDGTTSWLKNESSKLPHVVLIEQEHAGPAQGRNTGVEASRGDLIIFIDSDLVVTETFISSHARKLNNYWIKNNTQLCFTYGTVINTANFHYPTSEPYKFQDISWAYFATGNVGIHRNLLEKAGLFDPSFSLYGWEDLELGERLRQLGVKLIKCPEAVGYHWHPPLNLDGIPNLIRIEKERAKMGLVFFRKHPTLRVRFIIQFTWLHKILWEILTIGGIINEKSLHPVLNWLIRNGRAGIAMELLRVPLNRIGVNALFREAAQTRLS